MGRQGQKNVGEGSRLGGITPKKVAPKMPSQEQVLDKFALAFQKNLEGKETLTTGDYLAELEKMTGRAQKVLDHMAEVYSPEKHPKSTLRLLSRRELMQTLAERAELLSISKSLKAKGAVRISEEIVGMVNRAKHVSDVQYAKFLEEYLAGEKELKLLLKDLTLNDAERAAIDGILNRRDNLRLIEAGRGFDALRGGKYPGRLGIKGWVWEKAKTVAKANLADVLGGANWAVKRFTGIDPSAKLGEEIANQYAKKSAKVTTRVSPLNAGKLLIGGGLLVGVGFIFSQCGSCMLNAFGDSSKKGERPPVTARRTKKTLVEAELYASGSTRGKFPAIASLIANSGIPEQEQKKVASIVAKLPRQFIQGSTSSELKSAIHVINALAPLLERKISKDRIASTALDIMRYVEPSQAEKFAKELAKKAKSEESISAFFDTPPAGFKMTEEWLRRPFAAFKEAGFDTERDERLKLLCKAIRQTRVKKGRERVPIPVEEQIEYAEMLAEFYAPARGRKAVVPDTYQGDLQFLTEMAEKGFTVEQSRGVLERLKFVYKPQYLDNVADGIVKNLKPKMSEGEMRLAIESPAFKNRGYANDAWEKSTDPRLARVLTEGKDANNFSKNLRQLPQNLYEDALETLVSFTETWQSERRVLSNKEITPLIGVIEAITRSKELSNLSPEERGRILYRIATSVKEIATVERKRVDPRSLAIKYLNNALGGQRPTEAKVMDSLDAFLEENPGFAL